MEIMTPQQPFAWRALRRGATCVLVAAAVTAAASMPPATLPVRAHDHWDWIRQGDFRDIAGQPCCDVKDCKMIPATSGEVAELANGSFQYMPTGEVILRTETRASPDQNYWRCHWYENGKQVTRKLCFWRPVKNS